jgi:hypothetical protein
VGKRREKPRYAIPLYECVALKAYEIHRWVSSGSTVYKIDVHPDNIASRRTFELAGAKFVEIVDLPEDTDMYQEGERQKCRYRIDL